MRRKPFFLVLFILVISSVTACGYRGALYLPDEATDNQENAPEQPAAKPGDSN